uniref:Uncharacterized protein n=1 Tax=Rhizophora mucronata TaxID=61149 RepID=A0A2P2PDC6_RHIMU
MYGALFCPFLSATKYVFHVWEMSKQCGSLDNTIMLFLSKILLHILGLQYTISKSLYLA